MDTNDSFTGPINLGNPVEFTINKLAEKVIALTGSNSSIEYKHLPADDPIQRQPDISMAKKHLHWEPKIELKEGLERTIEYFEKVLKNRTAIEATCE